MHGLRWKNEGYICLRPTYVMSRGANFAFYICNTPLLVRGVNPTRPDRKGVWVLSCRSYQPSKPLATEGLHCKVEAWLDIVNRYVHIYVLLLFR